MGQKRDNFFPCMTPLWSCAKNFFLHPSRTLISYPGIPTLFRTSYDFLKRAERFAEKKGISGKTLCIM